jgi:glycoside/pentoside/hexuronide:cation symporter, GPH family
MKRNFAYALLGLPLAFFALPLYLHLPTLYSEHVGLPLATIGAVLLGARLLDAVLDPLIGRWCERRRQRKQMLLLALPFLLGGWLMLFVPPAHAGLLWLVGGLLLAYAGYSLATINHNAWGAEFPTDDSGRLQVTAWREGAALCGVLLSAGLPAMLSDDLALGLARLSWVFVPALLAATMLAVWRVPPGGSVHAEAPDDAENHAAQLWRSPMFRKLISVYAINGIAAAVPATLVLFYVGDVLQAGAWSGIFLLLYFLAGALALPFWVRLAGRIGRLATWRKAMLLAMASFAVTPFLGSGDTALFAGVCIASGIALGADLAMPPALLAEHVAQHGQAATSYGWWAAVTKLSLALAAGIALPLVAALGYEPGQGDSLALAWVYGGLPLLLKAAAYFSLLRARVLLQPLDQGVPA